MSTDSVYKVIEIVGTSAESWEAATRLAVETRPSFAPRTAARSQPIR